MPSVRKITLTFVLIITQLTYEIVVDVRREWISLQRESIIGSVPARQHRTDSHVHCVLQRQESCRQKSAFKITNNCWDDKELNAKV